MNNLVARGVRSLLSFLTTIPTGEGDIEAGAKVFYLVPLIGLFEGGVVGLVLNVLSVFELPTDMIAILCLVTHIAITGGIHMDGYCDYLDVIGSHKRGEEALKIMKDPRRGTFSVVILTLSLMANYISLNKLVALGVPELTLILIFVYVSAAESMYIIAVIGKEEPYMGLGHMFSKYAKSFKNVAINATLYSSVAFLLTVSYAKIFPQILTVLTLTIIVCLFSYRDSKHRLGFVTGDVMGFTYELLRTLSLLTLSVTI
ncbi:MAG: hypothetical protein B7O98_00830 [Zestosphaera tikiterensis]|uniref:Adenosylcobinamide-GDP ribazoletransferase n=1 Tax=Zestosphaera tikiterensis TaxID=1973259 RepID=A0A2R7Y9J6_9CREN|nr:MAG: hypothetical protein B7O98_00830 [Zestosphaera tikiterensis]